MVVYLKDESDFVYIVWNALLMGHTLNYDLTWLAFLRRRMWI